MNRRFELLGMVAVLSVAMTGSHAADEMLSEDARPFTRAELYAYLTEKTQVRSGGGFFYSGSGKLQTLADGDRDKGTWSTKDNGALCRQVFSWDDIECETYYHNGDVVIIVVEGKTMPSPELQVGNTLNILESTTGLFTKEEAIAFLSGKTVIWGPGRGLYYAPDFRLEKIWDGVRGTGRWSVSDEGAVCWHIPGWGPTPCESYYFKGEELVAIFNGEHSKAGQHVEGNRIGSF